MSADVKLDLADAEVATFAALEQLGELASVRIDPVGARADLRAQLASGAPLLRAIERVGASHQLVLTPLKTSVEAVMSGQAPLPLALAVGNDLLVIRQRDGRKVVARSSREDADRFLSGDDFAAAVGSNEFDAIAAAPAAPLQAIHSDEIHDNHQHASPWERIRALLHVERDDLWVVVVYAAAIGLLSLATPVAVQSLVSTVAFGTLLQPIVVLSILLLTALGFAAGLKALQTRVVESLQQRAFARVAIDLAWRLPRVKRAAIDQGFGPELVNRFFDVLTLQKAGATLATEGISTVLQFAIGVLVLAFYHPALLALAVVLLAVSSALVLIPARHGLSTSIDESKAKYGVAAWLEELARAPSAFRGSAASTYASARADALTRRYLEHRQRHFGVVFGQTVASLTLQVVTSAVLLGVGGWLVVQKQLTLGQLVAAEIIVSSITAGIAKFGKLLESGYDLLTSVDKLGHLVDLPLDASGGNEGLPGEGPVGVALHGASDGGLPLTLSVKAGSRVALVGASPAVLGEWLAGLRIPEKGSAELAGVDLRQLDAQRLHDEVMLLRNDDDLFAGSVADNVSLGRPDVTSAQVRAALERVGLDEAIRALPEGVDTQLSAEGSPLTESQRVRLAVARALACEPRLIVVEATLEGLDPVERQRTVAALSNRNAPWTLLVLAADPGSPLARACQESRTLTQLETAAQAAEAS